MADDLAYIQTSGIGRKLSRYTSEGTLIGSKVLPVSHSPPIDITVGTFDTYQRFVVLAGAEQGGSPVPYVYSRSLLTGGDYTGAWTWQPDTNPYVGVHMYQNNFCFIEPQKTDLLGPRITIYASNRPSTSTTLQLLGTGVGATLSGLHWDSDDIFSLDVAAKTVRAWSSTLGTRRASHDVAMGDEAPTPTNFFVTDGHVKIVTASYTYAYNRPVG